MSSEPNDSDLPSQRQYKGFFAHPVPRQQQTPPRGIPDGEGEHAPEVVDQRVPVFFVQVGDAFAVPVGHHPVPPSAQFGPEFGEVVDLAVEDHRHRAVLVVYRLLSPGHIDDREPSHSEHGMRALVVAGTIRAPVGEHVTHPAYQIGIRLADGDDSRYAAHRRSSSPE